jgi:rhodanese-related sulfurtransferase
VAQILRRAAPLQWRPVSDIAVVTLFQEFAMRLALIVLLGLFAALARAEVNHIDNEELVRLLAAGVPVIDIRTEGEWKETGIVKGSHLITFFDEKGRADAPAWLDKLRAIAKPGEPVAVICRTGNRTRVVAQFLDQQAGYKKVYNVKNGIVGWLKESRAVTPAAPVLAACQSTGKC